MVDRKAVACYLRVEMDLWSRVSAVKGYSMAFDKIRSTAHSFVLIPTFSPVVFLKVAWKTPTTTSPCPLSS